MRDRIKVGFIFAAVLAAGLTFFQSRQSAQTKVETAGQKFKNIKVLNDMPADQLGKVMNLMSASLGVDCKMCHVSNDKDFEKDGIDHKDIARKMITMTFDLNKNFFEGKPEVSCNTCHNGHERPVAVPSLFPAVHAERPRQPTVKPTIDQILVKYTESLGGKSNLAKIISRTVKAARIEPDGKLSEPEAIWQKGEMMRVETTYGKYVVTEAFDGKTVWKSGNGEAIVLRPDESEQIKREAQLFANSDLKSIYAKMDFRFVDKIDRHEVNFVLATLADNSRERLYFDAVTGELVRRIASSMTVLGQFQFQVDYSDYRDFGGVKIPTTIRFAVPNISWTRKIVDLKNNVPIDEGLFLLRSSKPPVSVGRPQS